MAAMKLDSKYFDCVRSAGRGRRSRAEEPRQAATTCAWEGCEAPGTHRAPLGRGKEGEYVHFCFDHVREYNRSYNYFEGMSDEAVAAYQKEALTGHRPTWSMGLKGARGPAAAERFAPEWSGLYEDPFGLFRGAASRGARPDDALEAERNAARRRLSLAEQQAFETLGLAEDAPGDRIKARYKALVKRHHPDANNGNRSSETRLRSVINAYHVLKRAGYC